MNGLIWLRSDLRLDDNPALVLLIANVKKLLAYTYFQKEWKNHNNANVKLDFIIRNLSKISSDLSKLNIPLVTAVAENFDEIPNKIADFCISNNIFKCYWNNEFGVDEKKR